MDLVFTQSSKNLALWLNRWSIRNYESAGFAADDQALVTFTKHGVESQAQTPEEQEEPPFGTHIRETVEAFKQVFRR